MREADGSRRIRFFPQKQMGFVSIDLAASGFEPAEVVALDAEGNRSPAASTGWNAVPAR